MVLEPRGRSGPGQTSNSIAAHQTLLDWLKSPAAYPHAPDDVQTIETHISKVFLAGELVYKLKKPVKYDFLDFRTLENREYACREEVRLNRRLAARCVSGVVPIVREPDGRFELGGSGGDVVDWLVAMRRIASDQTLDSLHRCGRLTHSDIDRLVGVLWRFYKNAEPAAITVAGYRAGYGGRVLSNYQELMKHGHEFPQQLVKRVHGFQLEVLHLRPAMFDARVQSWHLIEGHGDLRPEHICLGERIVIFDCIEFNLAFRQVDVVDELAFLASECDFIGASWAGDRLLQNYRDLSGDSPPPVLIDFYKSFRASVRAKVAVLRSAQLQGAARQAAVHDALDHLKLADQYAVPHIRPLIVAVGGLSGTGKTTFARHIADKFAAELLRSDVIRQELFGPADEGEASSLDRYSTESRQLVYQRLIKRAAELARGRLSVVVDATFSSSHNLCALYEVAHRHGCLFLAVECRCQPEIARRRIERRLHSGHDESEAGKDVYEAQRAAWQPWPSSIPQIHVDTEQPGELQVQQVITALAQTASA